MSTATLDAHTLSSVPQTPVTPSFADRAVSGIMSAGNRLRFGMNRAMNTVAKGAEWATNSEYTPGLHRAAKAMVEVNDKRAALLNHQRDTVLTSGGAQTTGENVQQVLAGFGGTAGAAMRLSAYGAAAIGGLNPLTPTLALGARAVNYGGEVLFHAASEEARAMDPETRHALFTEHIARGDTAAARAAGWIKEKAEALNAWSTKEPVGKKDGMLAGFKKKFKGVVSALSQHHAQELEYTTTATDISAAALVGQTVKSLGTALSLGLTGRLGFEMLEHRDQIMHSVEHVIASTRAKIDHALDSPALGRTLTELTSVGSAQAQTLDHVDPTTLDLSSKTGGLSNHASHGGISAPGRTEVGAVPMAANAKGTGIAMLHHRPTSPTPVVSNASGLAPHAKGTGVATLAPRVASPVPAPAVPAPPAPAVTPLTASAQGAGTPAVPAQVHAGVAPAATVDHYVHPGRPADRYALPASLKSTVLVDPRHDSISESAWRLAKKEGISWKDYNAAMGHGAFNGNQADLFKGHDLVHAGTEVHFTHDASGYHVNVDEVHHQDHGTTRINHAHATHRAASVIARPVRTNSLVHTTPVPVAVVPAVSVTHEQIAVPCDDTAAANEMVAVHSISHPAVVPTELHSAPVAAVTTTSAVTPAIPAGFHELREGESVVAQSADGIMQTKISIHDSLLSIQNEARYEPPALNMHVRGNHLSFLDAQGHPYAPETVTTDARGVQHFGLQSLDSKTHSGLILDLTQHKVFVQDAPADACAIEPAIIAPSPMPVTRLADVALNAPSPQPVTRLADLAPVAHPIATVVPFGTPEAIAQLPTYDSAHALQAIASHDISRTDMASVWDSARQDPSALQKLESIGRKLEAAHRGVQGEIIFGANDPMAAKIEAPGLGSRSLGSLGPEKANLIRRAFVSLFLDAKNTEVHGVTADKLDAFLARKLASMQ